MTSRSCASDWLTARRSYRRPKTDNAAIKINEKDIERQEKISGDLMKFILELTNRVSALEAEGKKKDERFERLED
jgi:HD-GYP domain-containing protein (c-di-GMP phosphodiesterase class II)